ncbi:MAG: PorT family protein [Muribaculaceae bacterium]|nr:PorT family protein [Muribaculaceae bacterium]
MKDKWLDELREGLSDFEMDPPEGLWESLGVGKPVSKNVIWRRRWMAAAAVIATLIAGSGILIWLSDIEPINVDKDRSAAIGKSSTQDNNTVNNYGENNEKGNVHSTHGGRVMDKEQLCLNESSTYVQEVNNADTPVDTVRIEEICPEDDMPVFSVDGKSDRGKTIFAGLTSKNRVKRKSDDRYVISMSASGIGNALPHMGNNGQHSDPNGPFDSTNRPGDSNGDFLPNDPDSNSPAPDIDNSIETTSIRHHQPVRFGLTLQYRISQRVGIETGLVYSGMESDISISRNNLTSTGVRKLHYVGIPLNVKISAWSWKFIDLYLSAGATGEKCVSNKFEIKSTSEDISLDAFSGQKEKPFQWSVNASAGIQLNPMPNIGIFAEPGVSYYFNDGSSLSTIYKDHPCNFNINVGLRFNINP